MKCLITITRCFSWTQCFWSFFFHQKPWYIRIFFLFLFFVFFVFVVLVLMLMFMLLFILLFLFLNKSRKLKWIQQNLISWSTFMWMKIKCNTLDAPSLSLSLSFSFDFPRLWLLLSSSFLNIPGSNPIGPVPPGNIPGSETELSEQNSVFIFFASGGLLSVSLSTVLLFSV